MYNIWTDQTKYNEKKLIAHKEVQANSSKIVLLWKGTIRSRNLVRSSTCFGYSSIQSIILLFGQTNGASTFALKA